MAYPKHAEEAARKQGTVSIKEFAKATGTAAVAAASQLPIAKALKAAKWALKAARKAGNARKVASLEKKVSLLQKRTRTGASIGKKGMAKGRKVDPTVKAKRVLREMEKIKANFRKAEAKGYHKEARDPADLGGWE